MQITAEYPGGNIIVKEIVQGDENPYAYIVHLEQDLTGTEGWWFYWSFEVQDAPSGTVLFVFENKEVVSRFGAVVQDENGLHWSGNAEGHTRFSYTFRGGECCRFSFSLPYTAADFERFASAVPMQRHVLAVSEQDREIPLYTFGTGERDVLLTSRHHCCETTGTYAMEGVVRELLRQPEMLRAFRFHVVPFVDLDGAENGDQGKSRIPHDHNRDYIPEPLYNVTKALYRYTEPLHLAAFLDLHSPWKWGGLDDAPHIHWSAQVGNAAALQAEFTENLVRCSQEHGIVFHGYVTHCGDNSNPSGAPTADNYFALERGAALSGTIETPYSGEGEIGYTPQMLLDWGADVANALKKTLLFIGILA